MLDDATLAQHKQRIDEVGYTILPDVFDAAFADAVIDDLARLERERDIKPANNVFEGSKTVRIYNLLVYGPLYEQIAAHDSVLPLVERVLDRGCLVSSLSAISICPGETGQPMHADDQIIPLPKPHPALVCNTMWAFTDFTRDNGATRILPGSHVRDTSPDPFTRYDGVIPAEMARGSVLVYHGSLWHKGGANKTDARRVGVAMNYCAGYIRQQENQQLGIPREIAARFSPRVRELVGYGVYKQLMGHIDKKSPAGLLDDTAKVRLVWDV